MLEALIAGSFTALAVVGRPNHFSLFCAFLGGASWCNWLRMLILRLELPKKNDEER
jgi:hypothetical protein